MSPPGPAWARAPAEAQSGDAESEGYEAGVEPSNAVLAALLTDEDRDPQAFDGDWMSAGGEPWFATDEQIAAGEQDASELDEVDLELDEIEILPYGESEPAGDETEEEPAAAEAGVAASEAEQEAAAQEQEATSEAADAETAAAAPYGPGGAAAAVPGSAAPAAKAGGGGQAQLSAWSAQVRQATATQVKAPPAPDAAAAAAPIRAVGGYAATREGARRKEVTEDVKQAVPAAPQTPEGIEPPPPIPVPAAETAVADATGKQLPAQTMPEVQSYTHIKSDGTPKVFQPTVGANLPSGTSATLAVPPPPAVPAGLEGAAAVEQVRNAGEKVPEGQQGTGQLVLGSAPRPGAPGAAPGPPVKKADVAKVLGHLRATAPQDAEQMLDGVWLRQYKGTARNFQLDDLDAGLQTAAQTEIEASISTIASQAGIDAAALEAATVEAQTSVETQSSEAETELDAAHTQSTETVEKEGTESAGAIAGARDAADDASYAKAMSAEGGADPEAIRARRDRLVERAYGRLAPEDIRYEREGEDRVQALNLVETTYSGGYTLVARQVRDLIAQEAAAAAAKAPPAGASATPAPGAPAGAAPAAAPAPAPAAPIGASPAEQWTIDRRKEATEAFGKLREAVLKTTQEHRDAITAAKTAAHDLIHEWADAEIDERSSWWESLWHRFQEWLTDAEDSTKAWKEARDAMLGADLQADLGFAGELVSGARSVEEMRAIGAMGGLSDAQKAIVASYFEGPDKGNPLAAVAAGMRVRIEEGQREHLTQEIQSLVMSLPPKQWDKVALVAAAEGGDVNILERGDQLHEALDQWGTDESAVYAALGGLTALQRHALDLWYQDTHGHTIQWALDDELSSAELDRAEDLMKGDAVAADAAALNAAIAGAGTDEAEIWKALRNKTPEERARLEQIYRDRYGESLEDALKGDLSGDELARGMALKEGNVAKADAIGLEAAKTGTWYGGADTAEIEAIYGQINAEVEKQAIDEGWSSEQKRAELLQRNQKVEEQHKDVYPDKGGLQESFKATLSGPELDLALGLANVDMARADAARLELERQSFITDDKVVNGILESQHTRARSEVTLDLEHDLRQRRELAGIRGEDWNDDAERKAMAGQVDELAQKRSMGYMKALEDTYDSSYSTWGKGGLQVLIVFNMSGTDQDKAQDLLEQGGKLKPDQEIFYAVEGVGTDVDALKNVLKGKTPEEIEEIEKAWDERFKSGPKMRARIMDEVGGRDTEDLDILLEGEPQTPQERLELARRKLAYEQDAYALGGAFSGSERKALEAEVAKLEDNVARLNSAEPGSADEKFLLWELDQRERNVETTVKAHRRSVDSIADTAAMVAAITAAVAVTVLTAGTAGVAVAGVLGALAATTATVATKALLKGGAYSEEEMLIDVASGIVDAAVAFATAGMGNALMRVADGIPIGPLAKLATSPSTAKRMLAHGIAEGVEGVVSSLPSAVVGTLGDEKTWRQGDMLTNVVSGVGMGVGMGAVMSGGMGALGGRARPDLPGAPHLDASRPLDLEAAAAVADGSLPPAHADPSSRAAQFQAQRAANPDVDYDQFVRDLEAGRIIPDPDAVPRFERKLQQELAAGLPPGQSGLLDGVSVEVLSDADFARRTKSASGQAVTLVEGGKPRILMRESADVHVLREEGIHAAQILDKRTASAASLLDEANMARWDKLPLETKIEMYRAKLDLEIDAQRTLLAGLRDSADSLPAGPARQTIADQIDGAARNLDNLGGRRVELDSFGLVDRLRARLGRGPLADRLDQPPRLFSKKAQQAEVRAAYKKFDAEQAEINAARKAEEKAAKDAIRAEKRAAASQKRADVESKRAETSERRAESKRRKADQAAMADARAADGAAPAGTAADAATPPQTAAAEQPASAGEAAREAQRKVKRRAAAGPLPDVRRSPLRRRALALLDELPPDLRKMVIGALEEQDPDDAGRLMTLLGRLDNEENLADDLLRRQRGVADDIDPDEAFGSRRQILEDQAEAAGSFLDRVEDQLDTLIDKPVVRVSPGDAKPAVQRSALKGRMRAAGLEPEWANKPGDWNPHHLIPVEFENHPLFDILRKNGGWDHNLPSNGIALPTRPGMKKAADLPVHQVNNAVFAAAGRPAPSNDVLRLLQGHPVFNGRVKQGLDELFDARLDTGKLLRDDPKALRAAVDGLIGDLRKEILTSVSKGRTVLF